MFPNVAQVKPDHFSNLFSPRLLLPKLKKTFHKVGYNERLQNAIKLQPGPKRLLGV